MLFVFGLLFQRKKSDRSELLTNKTTDTQQTTTEAAAKASRSQWDVSRTPKVGPGTC